MFLKTANSHLKGQASRQTKFDIELPTRRRLQSLKFEPVGRKSRVRESARCQLLTLGGHFARAIACPLIKAEQAFLADAERYWGSGSTALDKSPIIKSLSPPSRSLQFHFHVICFRLQSGPETAPNDT